MTKPKLQRVLNRTRVPGTRCPIEFAASAPGERGELGRVRLREDVGIRMVWWLRCPWCREFLEIPDTALFVEGGIITVAEAQACAKCGTGFTIADGIATRTCRGIAKTGQ